MAKFFHLEVKLNDNTRFKNTEIFKLSFQSKKISTKFKPGQFILIDCRENTYLRRPFSISNVIGEKIEIIYKKIGKGTENLSRMKKGDILNIIGPLGNGFPIAKSGYILIAGGIGIAPLRSLSRYYGILFYGTKSRREIVGLDAFKNRWKLEISTEDGSFGFKGKVVQLLSNFLKKNKIDGYTLCVAGPNQMYKELFHILENITENCYVSLENRLACGVGMCMGCNIRTKTGFKKICSEGPVFKLNEIIWEEFPEIT